MNANRVSTRLTIPLKSDQADIAHRAQQALSNGNGCDFFLEIKDQFPSDLMPFIKCWIGTLADQWDNQGVDLSHVKESVDNYEWGFSATATNKGLLLEFDSSKSIEPFGYFIQALIEHFSIAAPILFDTTHHDDDEPFTVVHEIWADRWEVIENSRQLRCQYLQLVKELDHRSPCLATFIETDPEGQKTPITIAFIAKHPDSPHFDRNAAAMAYLQRWREGGNFQSDSIIEFTNGYTVELSSAKSISNADYLRLERYFPSNLNEHLISIEESQIPF